MTQPYRLHYAPDNASLIVRLALEEMRLPYQAVLVDRRVAAQKSADYLALNPHGRIPVLDTPDGAIFETGAILLWLADRHRTQACAMMPPPDHPDRGHALKWLFFLSNTLHAELRMLFYPALYVARMSPIRPRCARVCASRCAPIWRSWTMPRLRVIPG